MSSEEDFLRGAIQKLMPQLLDTIDAERLRVLLYSEQLIDGPQKKRLKADGELLLDMVVDKQISVTGFMKVLKAEYQVLHKAICEGVDKFKSGEWSLPGKLDLKKLQKHLQEKYKSELCRLQPIPGEEFTVSLADEEKIMKLKFTAQEVALEARKNKEFIDSYQKLNRDKVLYKELEVSDIGDILAGLKPVESDAKNLQANLLVVTGDPGVGKTTEVQKLALQWANGKGPLVGRYKLVFFIRVSKVREGSFQKVLSDLDLLPQDLSDGYPELSEHAQDILFILDGIDENDITDQLAEVIEGHSLHNATVLMTSRPEARYLRSFVKIPRIKVSLLGTDESTVALYMRAAVCPESDEEWTHFENLYQEKLHDTSILHIPLYLTLIFSVFKANIFSGFKCMDLKIPETATQLFNAFMNVIIRRWLSRTNQSQVAVEVSRNPLHPVSNIPNRIKRVLSYIAKLCYQDLVRESSDYQFTESQASEVYLDMEDIKDCGLFTLGKSQSGEIFFLKHKQLQEYLAALYLASMGTKEQLFNDLMVGEKTKGQCLALVIRDVRLTQVVRFACGLSTEFFQSLIERATSQFCLMQGSDWNTKGQVDIYYETGLFMEQSAGALSAGGGDITGWEQLKNYLSICTLREESEGNFNFLVNHKQKNLGFYQKSLQKLSVYFSKEFSEQLRRKLYRIRLNPVSDNEYVLCQVESSDKSVSDSVPDSVLPSSVTVSGDKNIPCVQNESKASSVSAAECKNELRECRPHSECPRPEVSEVKLFLDQLLMELLGAVCVRNVKKVEVYSRVGFVDIPQLLRTFPDLTNIDFSSDTFIPYTCVCVGSDTQSSVSLTRVSLYTLNTTSVRLDWLLPQSDLTDLCLHYVDLQPLTEWTTRVSESPFPHLQKLHLESLDVTLCDRQTVESVCSLLLSPPSLRECDLFLTLESVEGADLIQETLATCTGLQRLDIHLWLPDGTPCTLIGLLCHILPHLSSLRELELSYVSVSDCVSDLIQTLKTHSHVKCTMIFDPDTDMSAETEEQLEEIGVELTC